MNPIEGELISSPFFLTMETTTKQLSKFQNKVWVILLLVISVVVLTATFVYISLSGIINDISEEARPDETVILMKEVLYDLTDAENNVKSYTLTGDANYLDEYNANYSEVNRKISKLDSLTDAGSESGAHVDSISFLIAQKFVILEELLILQGESRIGSAFDRISDELKTTAKSSDKESKNEEAGTNNGEGNESSSETNSEEKFFQKLLNKRNKKEKETEITVEVSDQTSQTKEEEKLNNEKLTYEEINKEIVQIKKEEERIDKSKRAQELNLIQQDKEITDRIVTIYNKMEENEVLNMEEKIKLADTTGTKTKLLIAIFCVLSCLLLIFAGFAVNTYVKRNDAFKVALRRAKQETDLKNKEITDSITYAQKIQEAILPDPVVVRQNLKDVFVLYKPKDIVAGDFYWTIKTGNKIFCAVADCTGHGVPGAMVSVVCSTALNRCVREFGLTEPAAILNKCRELVVETFVSGMTSVNDGMDIALISLEYFTEEGKEKVKMEYAGANNSIYIVRNNAIQDVPADKQPVGNYQHHKPFTNHKLELEKGAMVYLFSDGYADQFGGPQGKKFKYKPFQDLLVRYNTISLAEQKHKLNDSFETWRGNLEQIDDVCVIGVRV